MEGGGFEPPLNEAFQEIVHRTRTVRTFPLFRLLVAHLPAFPPVCPAVHPQGLSFFLVVEIRMACRHPLLLPAHPVAVLAP